MSKLPKQFEALRQSFPDLELKTVFDVGAHLGQSAQGLRAAAPNAELWAFEATPATAAKLKAALAGDPHAHVAPTALGDRNAVVPLIVSGTSPANRMASLAGVAAAPAQKIEMITGDSFCAAEGIDRINYLKIQTEGFDLHVLKGFAGMLAGQKIDLVEVEAAMHSDNEIHVQIEVFKAFLEPLGYFIHSLFGLTMEKGRPQLRRGNMLFASRGLIERHSAAAEPAANAPQPAPAPVKPPAAKAAPQPRTPPQPAAGTPGVIGEETALTLVFNSKYIEPVQVLLYSIEKHGNIPKAPLVIITDDQAVAEHPLYKRLAHHIEVVDDDTLSKFSSIKGERVPEHLKTYFAPKYTFLKFLLFKNRGYKRHLFMDADMLCLSALDHELLTSDYDAKAVLETSGDNFPVRDEPRDKFNPEQSRQIIERRSLPNTAGLGRNVNSGFLCLQGGALGEEVFENCLRIASEAAFVQEQAATSEMLRTREGVRFMELPIWYNFKRRIFDALGEEYFEENKHRVKILHYIPGKPWKFGPANRTFVDHQWWQYRDESVEWAGDMQSAMV